MLNRSLRQIVGPVVGASVVAYFAYHTVQGDRGLGQLTRLQSEVAEAEAVLAQVRGEREAMERRASLLRPDNLDPDMLEERARQLLNHAHPDDLVILLPGRPAPLPGGDTPSASPVSR
ncbi:MAG TPA: septum formation initiator family protein [Alphaproteobacteria bacterium]|nr:septum formation initiator family protein [Alphaproteobacteria bacterium]